MSVTRPLIRYFGGKWKIAPWIIAHLPEHRIYCELFGGGASVLLRKPRSYAEIYNDLDGEIVEVFRAVQTDFDKLAFRLRNTPFARSEYDLAYEHHDDATERAARTIVRSWMGFGNSAQRADGKTGFQSMSEITGSSKSNQWRTYLDTLETFRDRFMGVVVENRDAIEVMHQQDSAGTCFFVDPPYVPSTRSSGSYKYEMSLEDHKRLLSELERVKGMVILCGYDNELYNATGWKKLSRTTTAMSSDERTEVIWLNPAAENNLPQPELFKEVATT